MKNIARPIALALAAGSSIAVTAAGLQPLTAQAATNALIWAAPATADSSVSSADTMRFYVATPTLQSSQVGQDATITASTTGLDCKAIKTGLSNGAWSNVTPTSTTCDAGKATVVVKVTQAMVGGTVSLNGWAAAQGSTTVTGSVAIAGAQQDVKTTTTVPVATTSTTSGTSTTSSVKAPAPAVSSAKFGASVSSSGLKASGPIIATSGQVITGLKITASNGSCIVIPQNVHDVTIQGNELAGCAGDGIRAEAGSHHITVTNNLIHDVASGMWAGGAQHPITFTYNTVRDVRGPFPRGQMIQFDKVTGGSGQSVIGHNISDKQLAQGTTHYEDHINLYKSSGTAQAPISVTCNKVRGGDSESGSAIMAGDSGGSYVDVSSNVVVRVANVGIGVASGQHMSVRNNIIAQDGTSAASKTDNAVNVHNFYADTTGAMSDITLSGNRAVARHWINGSTDGRYGWSLWNSETTTDTNNAWDDRSLTGDAAWAMTPAGC